MIRNIELVDFLAHSNTKLEFENDATVFVGDNGAGKSSIIDAITFSLFGEHTRKNNKGLIRRGANQGFAKIEFSANGKNYQAIRKIDSKGTLTAQFAEDVNGKLIPIAEGERKQFGESMTKHVEETLGMDFEKLKIAIAYGADAVYAGVSHFSLRCHSGKEFDYETFKEAADYAHARGVKVYATVNSFPFENQLPIVEEHIKKLKEIGVDAMIISTLGVIMKAREIAPEIDIHLSTQANALNSWDYKAYRDLGVKRIIAARETTLKDMIKIKEKVHNNCTNN